MRPHPFPGPNAGRRGSGGIGDIDGDGDIDVFSEESEWNATRARWFVWENMDGKGGSFQRRTILEKPGAPNAIAADMDDDGDFDIMNKEFDPQPWNLLQGGQHADFAENQSNNPGAPLVRGPPAGNRFLRPGGLAAERSLPGPQVIELRNAAGTLLA